MAKLRVHGREVGTIYFVSSAKRYMSDGVVLKNVGFGWKIHGRVKDGFTPEQCFRNAQEKQKAFYVDRPANAVFVKLLHDMAGLSKRWKLRSALDLLGDDVDGIWSECCGGYGDNISASVDEVRELVRAYKAALMEQEHIKGEVKESA